MDRMLTRLLKLKHVFGPRVKTAFQAAGIAGGIDCWKNLQVSL